MSADRTHIAENDAARARLSALIARLSDEALARPMYEGMTVAGVLGHAAFWDARASALLDQWAGGRAPSAGDFEPENVDWINDAAKPFIMALSPRACADLSLQLAEEADAKIAALTDEQLATIRAAGTPFNLSRAEHRREHLDEIEAALGA